MSTPLPVVRPRRVRKLGRADLQGNRLACAARPISKVDAPVVARYALVRPEAEPTADGQVCRSPNPHGLLPPMENLKLRSRLNLFGCIHFGGDSTTVSLPCLVAGQEPDIRWRQWLRLRSRNDGCGRSEHCDHLPSERASFPPAR